MRSWVYAYDQDGKVTHVTESAPGEAPRTTQTTYDALTGRYAGTVMPAVAPASGMGNYGNVSVEYEDRFAENGFGQVKRVTTATGTVDYTFGPRGEIVRELHTVFARFAERTLRDAYAVRYAYNQRGALTDVVYEMTPGIDTESIHYAIDHDGKLQKVEDLRGHRVLTRLETNDAGALRKLHDGDIGQAGGVEEFQYNALGHLRDHIIGYEDSAGSLRTDAPTLTETVYRHDNGLPYASTVTDTGFSDLRRMTYYASIDGMGRLGFVQGSLEYRAGSGRPFSAFLVSNTYDRSRLNARTELMPGAASRTLLHECGSRDPSRMTSLFEMGRGTVYSAQYDGFGTMRARNGQTITNDPTEQPREDQNNLYAYFPNGLRSHIYEKQTGHIRAQGPAGIELDYDLVSGITGTDTSESGFVRTAVHLRLGHIRMGSHGPGAVSGAEGSSPLTYLHQDQQHFIILSCGVAPTDPALRYAFAPYGQTLFTNPGGETFPHRYGYQGGEMASTGLVRFGVRDFDSASGKWVKNDLVIGNDAQGYNLENPLAVWDPTGMDPPTQEITFNDPTEVRGHVPRGNAAVPQASDDERPSAPSAVSGAGVFGWLAQIFSGRGNAPGAQHPTEPPQLGSPYRDPPGGVRPGVQPPGQPMTPPGPSYDADRCRELRDARDAAERRYQRLQDQEDRRLFTAHNQWRLRSGEMPVSLDEWREIRLTETIIEIGELHEASRAYRDAVAAYRAANCPEDPPGGSPQYASSLEQTVLLGNQGNQRLAVTDPTVAAEFKGPLDGLPSPTLPSLQLPTLHMPHVSPATGAAVRNAAGAAFGAWLIMNRLTIMALPN